MASTYVELHVNHPFWHHDVKLVADWIQKKANKKIVDRISDQDDMKREIMRIILNSNIEFAMSKQLLTHIENDDIEFEDLNFDDAMEKALYLQRGDIVYTVPRLLEAHNKTLESAYRTNRGNKLPADLFGE